jgi:chromosome segregation ATPase
LTHRHAATKNPASMALAARVLAALLFLLAASNLRAQEEEPATGGRRARPTAASQRAAAAEAAEDRALLHQLADAQRALGDQVQQLKEALDGLRGEIGKCNEAQASHDQEAKAMREEVKGLYWESSTVKQQIDALKDDISAVNSNVSNFRTFSGFFIALMILLLAVIFVMTIRR